MNTFNDLNIKPLLLKAIQEMGYVEPTPIQAKAIPVILNGKDLVGQAQTGTGKTAAFSITLIETVDVNDPSIQGLVLCPTRELAIQVTSEIRKLSKHIEGLRVVPVYGGQSYDIQIKALKRRPQIVVGTPGRIIDLINRFLLSFSNIRLLILDEADEMLKMGFQDDLETILSTIPDTRQTCMFSATLPSSIKRMVKRYLKDYEKIEIPAKTITVDRISQHYFIVRNDEKFELLIRLLDYHQFSSVIVFCNTKKEVDDLVENLQKQNYVAEALHGDLKQIQRDRVMKRFRENITHILCATDVAARGLDVDDIDAVFNYDIPQEDEIYVHRIGRTGRAGKTGMSFTFVTKRQIKRLNDIEQYTKQPLVEGTIPSIQDIQERHAMNLFDQIKENIEAIRSIDPHPLHEKLLIEGYTNEQIVHALLQEYKQNHEKNYPEITVIKPIERSRLKQKQAKGNRQERRRKRPRGKRVVVYLNAGSKHNVK